MTINMDGGSFRAGKAQYQGVSSQGGLQAGHVEVVRSADELPPAPAGLKWSLEGVLESLPPQYKYKLVAEKRTADPIQEAPQSETSGAFVESRHPKWGTLVTVRQGSPMPSSPDGYEWRPTGAVYQTMPMQLEYRLEQVDGPSYLDAAIELLQAHVAQVQNRLTEELRGEDAIVSIDRAPYFQRVQVTAEERSWQSDSYADGLSHQLEEFLAKSGMENLSIIVRMLSRAEVQAATSAYASKETVSRIAELRFSEIPYAAVINGIEEALANDRMLSKLLLPEEIDVLAGALVAFQNAKRSVAEIIDAHVLPAYR